MFKGSPHFFGALYFLVFKWALPFERIENGSIRFRGFIYVWLHQATSHLLLSKSLPTCAPTPMEMLPCAKCMYTLYSLMVYVLNVYVLVHKMGTVCIFPSPLPRSLGSLWDVSLMSRSRPQKSRDAMPLLARLAKPPHRRHCEGPGQAVVKWWNAQWKTYLHSAGIAGIL